MNIKSIKKTVRNAWRSKRMSIMLILLFCGATQGKDNTALVLKPVSATVKNGIVISVSSCRGNTKTLSTLIDGNYADSSSLCGFGAPSWIEIKLPKEINLGRVVVYPGRVMYANFPSTELSPKEFVVQGWIAQKWQNLSSIVKVPRFSGTVPHRVIVEIKPTKLKQFRILIKSLYDAGKRLSNANSSPLPLNKRLFAVREIEWTDLDNIDHEKYNNYRRTLLEWKTFLSNQNGPDVTKPLNAKFADRLEKLSKSLNSISPSDTMRLKEFDNNFNRMAKHLAPWISLKENAEKEASGGPLLKGAVCRMDLRVNFPEGRHERYPASLRLDLNLISKLAGEKIDPYKTRVIDLTSFHCAKKDKKNSLENFQVPSQYSSLDPENGDLWWTVQDRTHGEFAVFFFSTTPDSIKEVGGRRTLGHCDSFYYDEIQNAHFPSNLWSVTLVDWDGDGLLDVISGAWTDYCHFWKNVGSKGKPLFTKRNHWLLRDEESNLLVANPGHPALGFSIPIPVDADGDGLKDIFIQTYYGEKPRFHHNISKKGVKIPVLAKATIPKGLLDGRVAFADLNNDGIADAVVVDRKKDKLSIQFGKGVSAKGIIAFDKPLEIKADAFPGKFCRMRLVPSLADIDGDKDFDLTLRRGKKLYIYKNSGDRKNPHFNAKPIIVQRKSRDLTLSEYYPWVSWADWDDDGDLDLVVSTGFKILLNKGTSSKLQLDKMITPTVRGQRKMQRANLRAFEMVDWDKDGDLDHLLNASRRIELKVSIWNKDTFKRERKVFVDSNTDWFGCPDRREYYSLYANTKLVDWDNDGDLDLFLTTEHSWRFGYIHYYENLGGEKFSSERRLHPDGSFEYAKFVSGKSGRGLLVNKHSFLDFLYGDASKIPEYGSISMMFEPNWGASDKKRRVFFAARPHPSKSRISATELYEYYAGRKPNLDKKWKNGMTLFKTADGRLRFNIAEQSVESKILDWKKGEWYRIEFTWLKTGFKILRNGVVVAQSNSGAQAKNIGAYFKLGSDETFMLQREREYRSRWFYHPVDFDYPVDGVFDDFKVYAASGETLLEMDFENGLNALDDNGKRSLLGYRCTPGFGDLNGDGDIDMVQISSDGKRASQGVLKFFTMNKDKEEIHLGKGVVLTHPDGKIFRSHNRTQVTVVDWNKDGLNDIILSTENVGNGPNKAVELYMNVGTTKSPLFSYGKPMAKLNVLFPVHHESKLCAVDLTGNGEKDIVISADMGTRVIYRSFLDEKPVSVGIVRVTVGGKKH